MLVFGGVQAKTQGCKLGAKDRVLDRMAWRMKVISMYVKLWPPPQTYQMCCRRLVLVKSWQVCGLMQKGDVGVAESGKVALAV